jgi:Putative binding domain, N-terminal
VVHADPAGNQVALSPLTVRAAGCLPSPDSNVFLDAAAQTLHFGTCAGTLTSGADWLPVAPAGQDQVVNIAPNFTGQERTGTLTFSGGTITVTQRRTVSLFADVRPSNPFFDAIDLMWPRHITSGCALLPLRYCPDDLATRGQMAVFMIRSVVGGDDFTYSATPRFQDAPVLQVDSETGGTGNHHRLHSHAFLSGRRDGPERHGRVHHPRPAGRFDSVCLSRNPVLR